MSSSAGPFPPPTPFQNFWYNAHGIGLTILWCLCADALLIIVRYCKNWHKYLLLHSLFGVVNILTLFLVIIVVVINSSWLFNLPGFTTMGLANQFHFIIGMTFIFTIVGVQALGLVIKFQMEGTKATPEAIIKRKKFHIVVGYSIYAVSKVQLVIGWYLPGPNWATMMTVLLVYYAVFFAFKFLYLQRLYQNQDQRIYYSIYTQRPSQLISQFDSITQMLQSGQPRRKILESHPSTRYVLFKDKVYDISNLLHPGGNYILQQVSGQQISRYIYGAYSYELTHSLPHKHTMYAHKMLSERYVGELDMTNLRLLVPMIGEKVNIPAVWTLRTAESVGKAMKCFVFQSVRYRVNPRPDVLYLGRHFLMSVPGVDIPQRLYTLTLCMSRAHRRYIRKVVEALEGTKGSSGEEELATDRSINPIHTESSNSVEMAEDLPETIAELPFVIKEYKVGGLSQHLHSMQNGSEVRLEGPFGRGLQLQQGHFFAFCGGTGVLPLLDLIYELLLQTHRLAQKSPTQSRLPPNFRLTMFLSVNSNEDLQGLDIIPTTYRLAQKYNANLFRLNLRVSKGVHPENIPRFNSRLDEAMLRNVVKESEITTALVCGAPEMNFTVGNVLVGLLGRDRVHVM